MNLKRGGNKHVNSFYAIALNYSNILIVQMPELFNINVKLEIKNATTNLKNFKGIARS